MVNIPSFNYCDNLPIMGSRPPMGKKANFTPITAGARRAPIGKKERFWYRRLTHIIANFEQYAERILDASKRYNELNKVEIKRRCEEYLKAATKMGDYGYVKVIYHPPTNNIGRAYTHTPSLQNLVRVIRHTIARGLYLDLDMMNAMPTLLSQYAEKNGLDLPTLKRYVTDRKKMLKELEERSGLSYEEGKAAVCSILNNGLGCLNKRDSPMWVTHLIGEMTTLVEHIQTTEVEIWRLAVEKAEKKKARGLNHNPEGSAVSMLYGHIEHQCLMCIHNKLTEKKLIGKGGLDISLVFDGCMTPIPPEGIDQEKLLRELESAVYLGTEGNYRVELHYKKMDEGLKIPDDEELQEAMEVEADENDVDIDAEMGWKDNALGAMLRHFTHQNVAAYYLDQKGDNIKYCGISKKWFFIDDPGKSCIWNEGDTALALEEDLPVTIIDILRREQQKIIKWCEENVGHPRLTKVEMNIETKFLNHIGNINFIQNTITKLRSMPGVRHDNFGTILDSKHMSLAFTDQILDLTTMQMRDITPRDHVHKTTGYPRPINSNRQIRDVIYGVIRGMVQGERCYHYLMSVLASCLPGYNMFQEFYILQGPGGNGKSLIYHIVSGALGGATGNDFEKIRSQCVVKGTRAANDHDDWLKTKGARAYWIPEVRKGDVLQEDVTRQQTGGEDIVARDPGAKTVTFRATATPLAAFNDMPRIPTDESIIRRIRVLPFPILFVHQERLDEEPHNPMLKLRVNAYEMFFKQSEYHHEFMLMLLEHFDEHVRGQSSLVQPPESKCATNDAIANGDRFVEFYLKHLVPDADAFIPASILLEQYNTYLEEQNSYKIGYKMLKKLMGDKGYEQKKKNNVSAFIGIRGLTPDERRDREAQAREEMDEYMAMIGAAQERGRKRKLGHFYY